MSTNDIIKRVQKGEIKLHELEEHVDPDMAADVRLQILESELNVKLSSIGNYTFDAKLASTNIENMIGSVQIPMGIAGPITVFGSATEGSFYLPLATTEGALVASVNRGCSAIRHAGGAITRVFNNAMTRAPVFKVANVSESLDFINWISTNYSEIEEIEMDWDNFSNDLINLLDKLRKAEAELLSLMARGKVSQENVLHDTGLKEVEGSLDSLSSIPLILVDNGFLL